jgi:CDP-diacylglycerol--glycerol-3-phosphate 3-phosphatidyltransferase
MKLANFFTAIRIFLAPLFYILFFLPKWVGFDSALSVIILIPLFIFMEFTDFLDGYFARKQNTVSSFGKLFDPFADVFANMTVLFCFVLSGYLPAILFLLVLYREIGIQFVRTIASKKGVAIGARKGGKTKTVLYITAASFSLALESASRLGIDIGTFAPIARNINLFLYIVAVIVSVLSFIDYIVHFSSLLREVGDE